MQKAFRIFLLIVLISVIHLPSLYPQNLSYDYLMELGKDALAEHSYQEALHYFKLAQLISPESDEPRFYINLAKRTAEGRVVTKERYGRQIKDLIEDVKKDKARQEKTRLRKIKETLLSWERRLKGEKEEEPRYMEKTIIFPKIEEPEPKKIKEAAKKDKVIETVYLDTASSDDFPLAVEVEPQGSFYVNSPTLKRFLIISPDVISVERTGRSTIEVQAQDVGSSFLHVWDDRGRWTFKVKIVPPIILVDTKRSWERPEGFKFMYSNDWNSYYKGRRFGTMDKQTLTFDQWAGILGPTPYGDLDASVNWSRLNAEDEITGYTVGLTEAKIFNFEDIYIRGFDFTHSLSPLSFPGQTLKGFFFRAPAFNKNIEYTVFYGREKQYYYGTISPGILSKKDAFIEGLRVGFFPYSKNKYYFNYAHGYGAEREDFLKDKVFSFESEHLWEDTTITSEIASDEDAIAASFSSVTRYPGITLRASFRDTEKKFVTISSRAPNLGEIGGMVGFDWHPSQNLTISSNLDAYRDRNLFNPDDPDAVNFNWDSSAYWSLSPDSNINTNIYYINAPGLSAPQRSLNATATYNKRFDFNFFGQRPLDTYWGYNYQRSINPFSPSSDYQRDGVLSGLRLQLTADFYYYVNHSYSWLEELSTGASSNPTVFETGIDYYHTFSPKLSSSFRLSYRDEQNASSLHSFLSGEDSLEGSANVTYSPNTGTEFFLDGRVRNIWAETAGTEKFIEGELRLGARFAWDSFFSLSPTAKIQGLVFKDSNGDGVKGDDEEGMANINVIAGPKEATTGKDGRFATAIKAKSAIVSIDLNTIPKGYILTTPVSLELDTSYGGKKIVNFGISPQSGIYGVVFFDVNNDGRLDKEDKPISGVIVVADGKKKARSNNEGVYFFGDLPAGSHKVALDVNSLPLDYLPKVAIMKEIQVEEGLTYTYHIPLKKK